MSDFTTLNTKMSTDETMINRSSMDVTAINQTLMTNNLIQKGTILLNKYTVEKSLDVTSGEAQLYICHSNNDKYIAKIYNRKESIKPEIIEKLKTIRSNYIAQICDEGDYNGLTITILPYYELGSLKGKRFSLQELKEKIIPCINEALNSLHQAGVIHKDLKPENIMLLPNNTGVTLIDFGISSVMENDVSMLVTQSGWTLNYAAPEAIRGLFLEESDYYSLGMTIYELYNGKNPYQGLNAEEIARYLSVQKLPYPQDMPQELKDLITGLTYNDLIHRNEKSNPNRRWTYLEVKKWLQGEKQPIPGEGTVISHKVNIIYKFDGVEYNDAGKLAMALAGNPSEGKKHLARKLLSDYFKQYDPEIASYCIDAEEELKNGHDVNVVFWNLIYKIAPEIDRFFWQDESFETINELGEEILKSVRNNNIQKQKVWDEILEKGLISQYLIYHKANEKIIKGVKSLENTTTDRGNDLEKYYLLSYLLIGRAELSLDGEKFNTIEELSIYINGLLAESIEKFESFCFKLISPRNTLTPEFEAWLIALGKYDELEKWKNSLRVN